MSETIEIVTAEQIAALDEMGLGVRPIRASASMKQQIILHLAEKGIAISPTDAGKIYEAAMGGAWFEPNLNGYAKMTEGEFVDAFKARMIEAAGPTFGDGSSIADYAEMVGPTYFEDKHSILKEPIECADHDMRYWADEVAA